MKANINEDELKLLAYLHEHATGYTKEFRIDPSKIKGALGMDENQLQKNISYLASHELAGMTTVDMTSHGELDSYKLVGVWLTGIGEDYMRELETQPGVAKKVTVAVVKEMGNAIRLIAVQVLSDLLTRHGTAK